jgi:hypothetical protein
VINTISLFLISAHQHNDIIHQQSTMTSTTSSRFYRTSSSSNIVQHQFQLHRYTCRLVFTTTTTTTLLLLILLNCIVVDVHGQNGKLCQRLVSARSVLDKNRSQVKYTLSSLNRISSYCTLFLGVIRLPYKHYFRFFDILLLYFLELNSFFFRW